MPLNSSCLCFARWSFTLTRSVNEGLWPLASLTLRVSVKRPQNVSDVAVRGLSTTSTHVRNWIAVVVLFCLARPVIAGESADAPPKTRPLEAAEVARLEPAKLRALLQKAQDVVEITPRLDGVLVLVTEGRLAAADESRTRRLHLTGRVRHEQQRPVLAQLVLNVMQTESFWATSDDEFQVITEACETVEPSPELFSNYYDQALARFSASEYEKADALFTRAFVEAPNRDIIHSWKAATAIALKQPERAEGRFQVLLRRDPSVTRRHAAQLERLQGPLRQALVQMEEKVLLKVRLGTTTGREESPGGQQ